MAFISSFYRITKAKKNMLSVVKIVFLPIVNKKKSVCGKDY